MEYKNMNSIILSGLPGSGKSVLARKLSEIYDWPIYSIGDIWRERHKKLYPNNEIPFEEYWKNTTLKDNLEVNVIAKKRFEQGSVIGDTRYSIYCRDLPALLVFITADLEIRANRAFNTGKYKGKSLEEIQQILLQREKDEAEMGQKLFGYDYRDPNKYDFTINSGRLTIEEELLIITNPMPLSF